ncbi:1-deoxy-D-xylulose-5-phosphate reductoisomerase [Vulgatibacter incomptus]|uniref:1-deoxy-D-xylulose 5-phosphate reductoisomerase n=1 Tax=Vulgatibacter incomptus TaxID=1391653 RepID=A0A0K1PCY3_9BACT|nr:1-deoxy-D-xylulose-5-phosphate reductoisomerase [Vulgatibacter incomptus]AKU91362.1 1-deoxy-D-xylulose 5-phosphate reductoisomerase [Vulgatibacter incomptus]
MTRRKISILGSTGSIGTSALDVVGRFPDRFEVVGLAAGGRVDVLAAQIRAFQPKVVSVGDEAGARALSGLLGAGDPQPEVLVGSRGACAIASLPEVDFVLAAIAGSAGMLPTAAAVDAGKVVGLANKESMVLAGEYLMAQAKRTGAPILPVDSEHSAIFQCLVGHNRDDVRRLVLTASGGPCRTWDADRIEACTPAEALKHPNWSMGAKITVDSATLMNKGLEVIEARWLFDLPPEQISIVVHPESVVHSMVEYVDGSVVAQLGTPDMRGPIAYALTWPGPRLPLGLPPLDLPALGKLAFEEPDPRRFPAYELAYEALRIGGTAPAVVSGADEAAVAAFLAGKIPFPGIAAAISHALEAHSARPVASVDDAIAASDEGRRSADGWLAGRFSKG